MAILRAGIWALACGMSIFSRAGEEAPPAGGPSADWPAVRDETFDVVWKTVNDSYYDATFGGVDWTAVGEKYRAALPAAADNGALRQLLQAMLGELRKTHFSIQPRDMAVFAPEERSRIGTAGTEVVFADGVVAVSAVAPDSPAQAAKLAVGDVILQAGEIQLAPLLAWLEKLDVSPARRGLYVTQLVDSRLHGPVGTSLALVARGPDGQERRTEVTFAEHPGEWSEPVGAFPSLPVVVQSRCGPDGVAYLRFNVFARAAMKDIRALLRQVPADGGLVIDLRGNGGGLTVMASGISGWLSDRPFQLGTMHLRQGHIGYAVFPQPGAFLGPVAVLIDSNSASTSEIMAAGLQEAGRARIFGEESPGAALPSLFKALPTGDMLQYAVADLQTPAGRMIEGRGVTPDAPVKVTLADLAAGRDPVVDEARRWLQSQRVKPARTPNSP